MNIFKKREIYNKKEKIIINKINLEVKNCLLILEKNYNINTLESIIPTLRDANISIIWLNNDKDKKVFTYLVRQYINHTSYKNPLKIVGIKYLKEIQEILERIGDG